MGLSAGTRLGPCEIVGPLGGHVALNFLPEHLRDDTIALHRLFYERAEFHAFLESQP